MSNITSKVRRLRFDFDQIDIVAIPSTTSMEPKQPDELRTIVDAVKGALELQDLTSLTLWLFPDDSIHEV